MKEFVLDNETVEARLVIGQSAVENSSIIKQAQKSINDHNTTWWFHLESVPSAHIIVYNVTDPKPYCNKIKEYLLLYTRKAPKSQHMIYTQVKNVKLTDTPGLVITRKTKKFR